MKILFLILSLVALCACCMGAGYVYGGTNLGYSGYPDFSKSKPYQPYDKSEYSARSYKLDVESYIRAVKEYVENAENDHERINNAIEEAISNSNRVIREYNDWVDGY